MEDEVKTPKLYFAHSISTYGTQAETQAIIYLRKLFPHHEIINPGAESHQRIGRGNFTYYKALIKSCAMLVYLPFADEKISVDVAEDVKVMLDKKGPVHELHMSQTGVPNGMCSLVTTLDDDRVLSIEKTRTHDTAYAGESKGGGRG